MKSIQPRNSHPPHRSPIIGHHWNSDDLDPFDPNNWPLHAPVVRVYGDDNFDRFAIIDQADAAFVLQHRWHWKPNQSKTKFYLTRATRDGRGWISLRLNRQLLLHWGEFPPTPKHVADHWDGDEFNYRRGNLRWLTVRQNNRNKKVKANGHIFAADDPKHHPEIDRHRTHAS